jgi:diguanylate cyclase (GGDEF)-like protein
VGLVQRVNEMLHEAAAQGVAVDEQFRTLESRARNDALTGALTRLGFEQTARDALTGAARCGSSITIVYLDLDGFKRANDTHGHAFGDKLLVAAAGALKAALPPAGLVGRLGGDEFVTLVTGLGTAEASAAAQTMLNNIAAAGAGHVTASAGLLYVKPTRQPQALGSLMAVADQLMYTAKRDGGNRFVQRSI